MLLRFHTGKELCADILNSNYSKTSVRESKCLVNAFVSVSGCSTQFLYIQLNSTASTSRHTGNLIFIFLQYGIVIGSSYF